MLADIFLGSIKNWDDPRIKQLNPGQTLPNLEISVVHRTEGKGSNYIFTDFLSKISPKWHSQIGKTPSPEWPVGASTSRGEDMMEKVKSTPGAIGYIELGFIQNTSGVGVGEVENAGGKFVSASEESIAAAYHSLEKSIPADFRASLTNAPSHEAYPIVSFTWLYVPVRPNDPERSRAMASYLEWALGTGQQSAQKKRLHSLASFACPKSPGQGTDADRWLSR